jgi:membrane-bound metal-dependent hydrolase YbcI (DUF457 family)
LPLVLNTVDVVVFYQAENSSKMAYYSGLTAVKNDIVTDYMAAYGFFVPVTPCRPENYFPFPLRALFEFKPVPFILACAYFLPQAYAAAF